MMAVTGQIAAAGVAMAIVGGLVSFGTAVDRYFHPPSDFMTVEVVVPDYVVGDDPSVQYNRTIHRHLRGVWAAEIRSLTTPGWQCGGTGVNLYSPNEKQINLSLSEFIGKKCDVKPGKYLLEVRWDFVDEDNRHAAVTYITEPFTVKEKQ